MGQDWERLGDALIAARVRLGFAKRVWMQRALGLTHDRTLSDLENAKRTNYDKATLASAEQWYGLATGNIAEILNGGLARYADEPPSVTPDGESALTSMAREISDGMTEDQLSELRAIWEASGRRFRREVGL